MCRVIQIMSVVIVKYKYLKSLSLINRKLKLNKILILYFKKRTKLGLLLWKLIKFKLLGEVLKTEMEINVKIN